MAKKYCIWRLYGKVDYAKIAKKIIVEQEQK